MVLAACALLGLTDSVAGQEGQAKADPWEQLRFLVGDWEGTAQGQGGTGTVKRSYAFILNDRFLHEKNVSTYPPSEKNQDGEVHEHWSLFSYDRIRKVIVLRQFHEEGFVNQYVMAASDTARGKLKFTSESFENLDNTWQARETYEVLSPDEFIETFELGAPGKELGLYSRNHFKRVKRTP